MSLSSYFSRLLRALLNAPEPAARDLSLARHGPRTFRGTVGETGRGVCPVIVYRGRELAPAAGVAVRYRVLDGPASVAAGGDSATVRTNAQGLASCDVRLDGRGASILSAELADDPDSVIPFASRTDGVVDELVLTGEPTVPADPGEIRVRISAYDFRQDRVAGARLTVEATRGADVVREGTVRELGDGIYEGTVDVDLATEWKVRVQDRASGVLAERCVHVLPGPAAEIRLVGTVDPRAEEPRDRLLLRAQLVDGRGNPLDPTGLVAEADGRALPGTTVRDEAWFGVSFTGYGLVPVVLRDPASGVSRETPIDFAAAVFEDPGFVAAGELFTTRLWVFPQPGRPVQRAWVDVGYDAELTAFDGFEREEIEGPSGRVSVEAGEPGRLTIALEGDREVAAEEFPEGIYACTLRWRCTGEGESCFSTIARMSPSTPPHELCVDQKKKVAKTLCVRIVHRAGDAVGKSAGDIAADEIAAVIGSPANVGRCCPVIAVKKEYCTISAADFTGKVLPAIGADGKDAVSSAAEFNALLATGLCKRDNCLVYYIVDFDDPGAGGRAPIGDGRIGLDPDLPGSRTNVGAHEAAHALGVGDAYVTNAAGVITNSGPVGNLMSVGPAPDYNHGTQLTKAQCQTVFANVDKFLG